MTWQRLTLTVGCQLGLIAGLVFLVQQGRLYYRDWGVGWGDAPLIASTLFALAAGAAVIVALPGLMDEEGQS